jgi:hypothetical protein
LKTEIVRKVKLSLFPPAINGNANGTIEADSLPHHGKYEYLKSFQVPKEHKEPATANEFTSILLSSIILLHKRKTIIIIPATIDAFSDSICPCFDLKSTIIGIVPTISITAKAPFQL